MNDRCWTKEGGLDVKLVYDVEADVEPEPLPDMYKLPAADEMLVVAECVPPLARGGMGAGIPGPSGGYSDDGAVSALRRDCCMKGRFEAIDGREGEVETGPYAAARSANVASVGVANEVTPHSESSVLD